MGKTRAEQRENGSGEPLAGRGYIRVERDAIEHPFFRRTEFSEYEAWLWLLGEAAWKPRQSRLGEFFVALERGQLVAAVRYLADEWGWSKGKVERFLFRLKNEAMIETQSGTGINVITICNYDKYQGSTEDDGTPADSKPGQVRDKSGTVPGRARDRGGDNNKAIKHSSSETGETLKSESHSEMTLFADQGTGVAVVEGVATQSGFADFYAAYPKKVDPDVAEKTYDRVIRTKKATAEQLLEGAKRYAAEMRGTEKRFMKGPSVWLNAGAWKNEAVTAQSRHGVQTGIDASLDAIQHYMNDGGDSHE